MPEITRTVENPRGKLEVTFLPITVDKVEEHPWRDGYDQAQIRQTLITHYPSSRPNSDLVDDLFELSEFGIESSRSEENIRVTWIDLPKGTSVQDVEQRLLKFPEGTIYRIMGDEVDQVLNRKQLFAAYSDDYPKYNISDAQRTHIVMKIQKDGIPVPITKYGEELHNSVTLKENGKVDEILHEEGLQYRNTGFSFGFKPDTELREGMDERPSKKVPILEEVGDPAKSTA